MSVELFRDDDQGYAAWLAASVQGHVGNIQRSLNPSDARVHEADCRTIISRAAADLRRTCGSSSATWARTTGWDTSAIPCSPSAGGRSA